MKITSTRFLNLGLIALASVICIPKALATDVSGTYLLLEQMTLSPFGFTFKTELGKAYTVADSTDLNLWKPVQTIRGTGNPARFTEHRKRDANRQFYRVRIQE